jgi:hypothetical protein
VNEEKIKMHTLPDKNQRIILLDMPDDPDPITPGTRGTVLRADSTQVVVKWDNGRSLNLIPEVDSWRVLSE